MGFWLIDKLTEDATIKDYISRNELYLAKNKNFMNEAGLSLKKVVDFDDLTLDNLCVIHDDWDLRVGVFKLQKNRSSARHKGVQSVIDALGSKDFWRLRIGIGPAPKKSKDDFVLGKITRWEQKQLEFIKPEMVEVMKKWIELNQRSKVKDQSQVQS